MGFCGYGICFLGEMIRGTASTTLSLGQRCLIRQQPAVKAETHNSRKCWEWLTLTRHLCHHHPKSQRTLKKRAQRGSRSWGMGEVLWNAVFWTWCNCHPHKLTEAVITVTEAAHLQDIKSRHQWTSQQATRLSESQNKREGMRMEGACIGEPGGEWEPWAGYIQDTMYGCMKLSKTK